MRRVSIALMVVLTSCSEEAPSGPKDAGVQLPDGFAYIDYPKAIDWKQWGAPCTREEYEGACPSFSYGSFGCEAKDGTKGACVVDWHGMNSCRATCSSNPPYLHECPEGSIPIHDGYHSQSCYCAELPL